MNRPLPESPLVISYGVGVDSTAILVELARRYEETGDPQWRPDMIIHADVGEGNEYPILYRTIPVVNGWLRSVGFPEITVVRKYSPVTRYHGLLENCLHNCTLPSLAYGGHSCSLKWKIEGIDDYVWGVRGWQPAFDALADGRKVVRVIGYDYGCADSKRFAKMDRVAAKEAAAGKWSPWHNWYPLRDWEWTREDCIRAVEQSSLSEFLERTIGIRCVRKSACWFCPAMKQHEVMELGVNHPDLALRAAALEYRARTGKHGLETVNGLGLGSPRTEDERRPLPDGRSRRNWSWTNLLLEAGLLPEDWEQKARDAGHIPPGWDEFAERCKPLRERVLALKSKVRTLADVLPDEYREKALKGNEKVKQDLDKEPRCSAWSKMRHELKEAQADLKLLVAPEWADVPKPVEDPDEKAKRKAARARWRKACEVAQRIEAARAEAPEPEDDPADEACVATPVDDSLWIVYDAYNRGYVHLGESLVPSPVAALKMPYEDAVRAAKALNPRPDDAILIRDPRTPRERMVWYDPELPGWPLPDDEEDDI